MVKYGNYTDGWVAFNCKDNLIQGGYNSEVTFFIKKDGSSSFGGGLNGQSFNPLASQRTLWTVYKRLNSSGLQRGKIKPRVK